MMRRTAKAAALSLGTLFMAVSSAHAQRWSAELQAGQMRSSLDAGANAAQTLAAGLRYDALNGNFAISAGIPTSGSETLWGALGAARRLTFSRSGLVAGIDLAGNAYVMHQRAEQTREVRGPFGPPQIITRPAVTGNAFAGQALPLIGYETLSWQVHVRGGASFYTNHFGDVNRDRQVVLADAQLTFTPSPNIALIPVVRHFKADDEQSTYAGASAALANEVGSVWVSAGFWPGLDTASASWSAGASLKLLERATLSASARRDGYDALYMNPPQTSWSIGVALQLGKSSALRAPVPAAYDQGRATIRLEAARVKTTPMIAGDFTNWKPRPMQRSGDAWTYTTPLAPGVYNYAFVDGNGNWFVPADHPGRKDDGMGGTVAVLVVR